jgi:predicted porin
MKVDASRIARATGGIDGDFTYFLNAPGSPQVIATPDLYLDYGAVATQLGDESLENLNKVTYYTPRFSGFQLGVSYVIDQANRGQTVALSSDDNAQAENIFQGAISYEGKFDQIGFAAGLTGEWGNAEVNTYQDLRTWQGGAKLSYMGFSLAGSYGHWGDSLRLKSAGGVNDTWFWDVGASYENGPFGVSVTYLDSNYEATTTTDNEFTNVSVGVDYKLAPGLTPYAEVSFVQFDPTGTANDNDATIGIVGTVLNF